MAYKNKIYVAFGADNGEITGDMKYYRMMSAWKENSDKDFEFADAHDLNNLMATSSDETIKAKLRERLNNTKLFILLVGDSTKSQHNYIIWEIEEAMKRDTPMVVVNLNKKTNVDLSLCPPIIKDKLSLHIGFYQNIIYEAIKTWISFHEAHRKAGEDRPFHYLPKLYDELVN